LISCPFDGYGDDLLPSDISADFPAYEFFHTSFGIYFPLDFN
jgi:hypothetical protein